ncbi:hypothetical protein ES703_56317 [subsurface metagenome]
MKIKGAYIHIGSLAAIVPNQLRESPSAIFDDT